MHPIGLDMGNAAMKLCGPNPGVRYLVPHALALIPEIRRDSSLLPVRADPLELLHAEVSSPSLRGSPLVVAAGVLAAREYPQMVTEVQEGERKVTSDTHLTLALVALAHALIGHPGPGHPVSLCVALPMAEAADAEARKAMADRLSGEHTVRWLSTPGRVGLNQTVRIASVEVVPEGAAAYLAIAAQNMDVLKGHTLVVDVGARSLDWAVFAPGGKFVLGLSGGTVDGGLSVAADRLLAAARQKHGPTLARHRQDVFDALETAGWDSGKVTLYGRGHAYDVTELAHHELMRLARDVARLVAEVADRMGRVEHMALVGGGGALLAPYLQQAADLPLNLYSDATWANAEGLYRRAQQAAWRGASI